MPNYEERLKGYMSDALTTCIGYVNRQEAIALAQEADDEVARLRQAIWEVENRAHNGDDHADIAKACSDALAI